MGTTRYLYNKAIELFQKNKNIKINRKTYRNKIGITEKQLKENNKLWQKETYFDTREYAINEAVAMIKSAISNKKNGNIKKFKMKFRSKKNYRQTFNVDIKHIKKVPNGIDIFPNKHLKIRISSKVKKKLRNIEILQSCKVIKTGKLWHLSIPYKKKREGKNAVRKPIIALDPGLRKFQSGYDTEGNFLKFGENYQMLLKKLGNKLDKLKSLRAKSTGRKRYHLKLRCWKLITKVNNNVTNFHNQIANYLSKNYDNIVVSDLDTSDLVEGNRKLSRNTKRYILRLAHGKFRTKLIDQSNNRNNRIIIISESYTSKTCTGCGMINNVGSSEHYCCDNCFLSLDRDLNGSRNILLKALVNSGANHMVSGKIKPFGV